MWAPAQWLFTDDFNHCWCFLQGKNIFGFNLALIVLTVFQPRRGKCTLRSSMNSLCVTELDFADPKEGREDGGTKTGEGGGGGDLS